MDIGKIEFGDPLKRDQKENFLESNSLCSLLPERNIPMTQVVTDPAIPVILKDLLDKMAVLTEKVDRLLTLCGQTYLISDKIAQESDAPGKDGPAKP